MQFEIKQKAFIVRDTMTGEDTYRRTSDGKKIDYIEYLELTKDDEQV